MSLHISDSVIWQESEDGVSLYNMDNGDFLSLNGTGAQIWLLVASDGGREPVISKLILRYAGSNQVLGEKIRTDVEQFINSMVQGGMLVEGVAA
ncbi:MAG TPA: PqqD family protein [Jatrophihabitans sp.]|nr:PqqD family protein [Jatrophihabitans sp.]